LPPFVSDRRRTAPVVLRSMSGAEILMDRPPGGWGDLVTNHTLDVRFAAFEERSDRKLEGLESRLGSRVDALESRMELRFAEVDHRFDRFEHELVAQVDRRLRSQAWVTISTVIAAMSVIVAAIRI
jgi:hypothetical protein